MILLCMLIFVTNKLKKIRVGVQWYMLESEDFNSIINFKLKNENNELVSFKGKSLTFCLSNKKN